MIWEKFNCGYEECSQGCLCGFRVIDYNLHLWKTNGYIHIYCPEQMEQKTYHIEIYSDEDYVIANVEDIKNGTLERIRDEFHVRPCWSNDILVKKGECIVIDLKDQVAYTISSRAKKDIDNLFKSQQSTFYKMVENFKKNRGVHHGNI